MVDDDDDDGEWNYSGGGGGVEAVLSGPCGREPSVSSL